MSHITFDFKGIVNLLAKHLYSEKKVFVRELVQNAHDAICRRRAQEKNGGGRIDIYCHPEQDRILFKDSGIGMSRSDLEGYLSSIGASGTRSEAVEGVIGQFGIGFLSAYYYRQAQVLPQVLPERPADFARRRQRAQTACTKLRALADRRDALMACSWYRQCADTRAQRLQALLAATAPPAAPWRLFSVHEIHLSHQKGKTGVPPPFAPCPGRTRGADVDRPVVDSAPHAKFAGGIRRTEG